MKLVGERLGKVFVNGTVGNLNAFEDVNFNFNVFGDDLADLHKIAGKPLPVRGPFAVSGNLTMPNRYSLRVPDLKVILDKNSLNGFLALDLEGPIPRLSGTISSNRLNLKRLLSQDILPANILESLADVGPTRLMFETSGTSEQFELNRIEFNTKLGDFGELNSQGSIGNLHTFSGIDLSFMIRGTTRTIAPLRGISLDFSIRSRDLSILNNAYHTQYVNKLPIHITGRLEDPQPGSYKISSLQATYGDSDLSGSASLNLHFNK